MIPDIQNAAIRTTIKKQWEYITNELQKVDKILSIPLKGDIRVHKKSDRTYYEIVYEETPGSTKTQSIKPESEMFNKYAAKYCAKRIRIPLMTALKKLENNPLSFDFDQLTGFYEAFENLFGQHAPPELSNRNQQIRRWCEQPFTSNPYPFNAKSTYITEKNLKVRSKNEYVCATTLDSLHIPYRYEAMLQLTNGKTYYPDFTILNIHNGQECYFEIFGMMSNNEYSEDAFRKINEYENDGYLLGDRLFVFFESESVPFNIEAFRNTLKINFSYEDSV